jgi:tRNA threonylcarbamoyladenosine biosynthesis protein TsaB
MTRTLLAFDTATELLSVGLRAHGRVHVHAAPGGALASAALLPAIETLLEDAGVALRDVDAIVFGRGPGAFTGLRTACSVAQGLAFGIARPVLPVDTLLALAEDARGAAAPPRGTEESLRVWALLDARMNEIYAAQYAFDGTRWQVLDAPMLTTPEALNARWRAAPPQLVAGNALEPFGARLECAGAHLVPGALPRAAALLSLAPALLAAGAAVDAALALPLYVREKVAQTTAERDAARAAKLAAAAQEATAR